MAGRERNPERSRERILDAALEEFAANGLAGARVDAIARRAGLNKQLISHHFGGKEALYRAVMAARRAKPGGELAGMELGELPGALATLFDRARHDPAWIRVLLWEVLEDPDVGDREDEARRERYRARVAWVEREQAAGRLPADLAPDLLYLSLVGAAAYSALLPRAAELITGQDPAGESYRRRYRRHLVKLAGHLAARGSNRE